MAKNCKKCKSDDKHFCETCEFENYLIDNETGDCIEKNESISSIIWTVNELSNNIDICLAKNCKRCKSNNQFFCDICEFENYFVDNITGDCIEENESIYSTTWTNNETIYDKCKAKNCKQCKLDNEHFCEICEFENYVVNNITGDCVKKNESIYSTESIVNEKYAWQKIANSVN